MLCILKALGRLQGCGVSPGPSLFAYMISTLSHWQAHIGATSWENLFLSYANNKGADQPAHPRSLISAFVVRCLDSIILLLAIAEISRL